MTSRKEGMDPVVIALTLGIVMVGGVAWAVKGMAAPDLMRLKKLNKRLETWRNMLITHA